MKIFLLSVVYIGIVFGLNAQTIESAQSGDWNSTSTWVGGVVPTAANSSGIVVNNSHTVTVNSNVSADQMIINDGGELIINSGSTFTVGAGSGDDLTVSSGGILEVSSGAILTIQRIVSPPPPRVAFIRVYGIVKNSGTINNAATTSISFEAGSIYNHEFTETSGAIPSASWNVQSTCLISGYTTNATAPTGLSQSFGNFTWDTPNLTEYIDLQGALVNVNGDLVFQNITGNYVYLAAFDNYNLNVGGDFVVDNSNFAFNSSANASITVTGEMSLVNNGDVTFVYDGTTDLSIGAGLNISSGSVNLTYSGPGSISIDLSGDFLLVSSPAISNGGSGVYEFTFSGLDQSFIGSGGFPDFNYTISSNSLEVAANSYLSGNNLLLQSGSELRVMSTASNGAIQSGTSNGNIRVSGTRTYESGSTITYNGTSAQFIGAGHPTSPGVNLTINNSSGVSMVSNLTVGNALNLQSGNLSVGNNTLTLDDGIMGTGTVSVTANSNIVLNGNNSSDIFPFLGSPSFNNFTLNRAGGSVTFDGEVTINGTLTLTNGNLIFKDQTLNLNGTLSNVNGLLSANSSSILEVRGSSNFGSLAFSTDGNVLNELTIDRANGEVDLIGTLNIANTLNLQQGTFDNTNGTLTFNNGTNVFKNSTATLTGNSPEIVSPSTYNVTYTGASQISGAELPSSLNENDLGDLTINSAETVTLSQSLQVNGNITLESGVLSIGANTLSVQGDWIRNNGSLANYSGMILFDGNTTISAASTPTFRNVTISENGVLNMPASNVNFASNILVEPGGTLNAGSGTIVMTGTNNQTASFANSILNNFTIDKTSGTVNLTSAVSVAGRINFTNTSASTLASGGNLTLLSTADSGAGDAWVSSIPTGASITGNVVVQRYIGAHSSDIYRYIGSSVEGATLADLSDDIKVINGSLFYYDESLTGGSENGWRRKTSGTLEPGRGYSAYIFNSNTAKTISMTGVLNQGAINLPVSYTTSSPANDADGWNLVANPYPSPIFWGSTEGWTKTNIDGSIYLTDNEQDIYRYWNGTEGNILFGRIAKGQSFWVQASGASPQLSINENAKTNSTAAFYRESEKDAIESLEIVLIDAQGKQDYAYFGFKEGATNVFDNAYDAMKMDNQIFDLSTIDGEDRQMAINIFSTLSCSDSLKINIKDATQGTYNIKFNDLGVFFRNYSFELYDSYLNHMEEVTDQSMYSFSIDEDNKSTGNRFFLIPKTESPVITLSEGNLLSNQEKGNRWYFNGQLISEENVIYPEQTGVYTLDGCNGSTTYEYIITGVDEYLNHGIRIYPNPLIDSEELNVHIGEGTIDYTNAKLELIDSKGRVVDAMEITNNFVKLNVKSLPSGVYLLSIFDKNASTIQRIMKL
ncbi:T9SS type A sorting domain-containing protein [Fulvivirga sediminis]|uniref:T9SS type A sorting domain-containing protein n=1 Tax=Fulvivirga sediminis TaxID=2803949 RepID=A0A937F301_9BACT|nr:T9SS type A sorting domain-containing protein [Fulvivirga sediminis]MBL3655371.1 T9SS type A sorting domain-containing protein [Fulvivirga sediminis]